MGAPMSGLRLRVKRTLDDGPPENLLFGEVAYSDGDGQLYVGRPDSAPPTIFKSDASPTIADSLDRANHTGTQPPGTIDGFAAAAAAAAPVQSVAGKGGEVLLTKADVGLSAVDNTADSEKPISTATEAALYALESATQTALETRAELTALAALQAQVIALAARLPVVGSVIHLPYPVTPSDGLWTSPEGLIYYAPTGNTIGAASSGATVATAAAQALYGAIWVHLTAGTVGWAIQTSTGALATPGASAAADWAANKRLVVPDMRGRAILSAGQGSGLTNRAVGTVGGAEAHSLTAEQNGPHIHQTVIIRTPAGPGYDVGAIPSNESGVGPQNYPSQSSGSGSPHNNMQPWAAMTQLWFVGVAP